MESAADYSSKAGSPGDSNCRPAGGRCCWNCATDKVGRYLNYPHLKTWPSFRGVCEVSFAFMFYCQDHKMIIYFSLCPKLMGSLKHICAMRHPCCMYRMRRNAYYKHFSFTVFLSQFLLPGDAGHIKMQLFSWPVGSRVHVVHEFYSEVLLTSEEW